LSFDYPITFYLLQGNGLYQGSLYSGDYDDPTGFDPLDHSVIAMPGLTVGVEFQFLNFMSFELNYQFSLGDTRVNSFLNMAFGAELKFPIKFAHILFAPYITFFYPITVSDIFVDFPPFAAGGGVQFCARGGKHGAFFFDIKYMLSFHDAVMKNPYLAYPEENQLYPEPSVIHYKRSMIGIGVGYKFGILDRK
jgi:hypothetical protein